MDGSVNPQPVGDEFITQADIARIAGVGPSAVANWRKRRADFPAAAQDSSYGALFAKTDVLRWLQDNKKQTLSGIESTFHGALQVTMQLGDRQLSQALDQARAWLRPSQFPLVVAALTLAVRDANLNVDPESAFGERQLIEFSDHILKWINVDDDNFQLHEIATMLAKEPETTLMFVKAILNSAPGRPLQMVLDRDRGRRYEPLRPSEESIDENLAELMVSLIGSTGGTLDPFVRDGRLLMIAGRKAQENHEPFIGVGFTPNPYAHLISQAILTEHKIPVQLNKGWTSSLSESQSHFDRVLSIPPLGMRTEFLEVDELTHALLGTSVPRSSDLVAVASAAAHLSPNGRAAVLTGLGSTFGGGKEERTRAELVRRGCVETIIALPGNVNLALWILRAPDSDQRNAAILLVNANGLDWRTEIETSSVALIEAIAEIKKTNKVVPQVTHVFISPLDALGPGVPLNPVTETARMIKNDPQATKQLLESLTNKIKDLNQAQATVTGIQVPKATLQPRPATPAKTIQELAALGHLKVIQGRHIPPEERIDSGIPIWTTQRLGAGLVATEFVASREKRMLTEPGDVIFFPVGTRVRAVVDELGGSIAASPLVIVRLEPNYSGLTPHVLAAVLSSSQTQRLSAGTVVGRVDIKTVPIPTLDPATCSYCDEVFRALTFITGAGEDMILMARSLGDGLASGLDEIAVQSMTMGTSSLAKATPSPASDGS